ncbi:RRP36 [Lepeophtheirus salmonis]|uniref:rRNA biogenesis protein RRP36 n=1 Tax=Lepeophtheirus salmonis TaxID=72036 RepID=A0A7R8H0H7_LEPSM|nr:RRP36 [Lepeophtheirus salmonis]CAF2791647.1 RRP36 [Lepeophtheirus salmonis]
MNSAFVDMEDEYVNEPSTSSQTEGLLGGEEPKKEGWAKYEGYFDVDTEDVIQNIKSVLVPKPGLRLHTLDLYGPFWIATTLVFSASLGADLRYDFDAISIASGFIFPYALLTPLSPSTESFFGSSFPFKRTSQSSFPSMAMHLLHSSPSPSFSLYPSHIYKPPSFFLDHFGALLSICSTCNCTCIRTKCYSFGLVRVLWKKDRRINYDPKSRNKISSLSIEELQQLKSKMGLKAYNDSVGNPSSLSKHKNTLRLKRDNKNRPRETSSKKTVSRKRKIIDEAMPEPKRDPRFDSACGEFNEKIFKDAYTFVDKIKDKEQKHLKERLETETDQEELQKIKYLIQRHDNQVREKT